MSLRVLVISFVLGLWCSSCMAAGDKEEESSELPGLLKTLFGTTRNGVKLGTALIMCLITYYISEVKVTEVDEIPKDEPEEMEEAACEAWQNEYTVEMPRSLALRVRKWAGFQSSKSAKETLAGSTSVGDVAEEDRQAAAKAMASGLDLSPYEKEKVVKDMAVQGLTSERIVALSLSLILGKVSKLSLTVNMKYGEDPALSEPAKQARKANKKILPKIISGKNFADAASFFSDLARNYAADGMAVESSLVATWWAETSGCFSVDAKEQLFKYLEEYFEKYAGRGLPVMIDTVLVTRIRNAAGGSAGIGKEDFKNATKRISELEDKIKKLNSRVNDHDEKIGKKKPTKEEQDERRKNVTCHNCGKKGHYKSECPDLEKDEDEG